MLRSTLRPHSYSAAFAYYQNHSNVLSSYVSLVLRLTIQWKCLWLLGFFFFAFICTFCSSRKLSAASDLYFSAPRTPSAVFMAFVLVHVFLVFSFFCLCLSSALSVFLWPSVWVLFPFCVYTLRLCVLCFHTIFTSIHLSYCFCLDPDPFYLHVYSCLPPPYIYISFSVYMNQTSLYICLLLLLCYFSFPGGLCAVSFRPILHRSLWCCSGHINLHSGQDLWPYYGPRNVHISHSCAFYCIYLVQILIVKHNQWKCKNLCTNVRIYFCHLSYNMI